MDGSAAPNLRLQWRDHGSELAALSRDVFRWSDVADITLACLAAASTFFRCSSSSQSRGFEGHVLESSHGWLAANVVS